MDALPCFYPLQFATCNSLILNVSHFIWRTLEFRYQEHYPSFLSWNVNLTIWYNVGFSTWVVTGSCMYKKPPLGLIPQTAFQGWCLFHFSISSSSTLVLRECLLYLLSEFNSLCFLPNQFSLELIKLIRTLNSSF